MGFVIASRRPLGQMADQRITRQLELCDAHSGALDVSGVQIRRLNVRDEIGFPNMLHAVLVTLLSYLKEILRSRVAL